MNSKAFELFKQFLLFKADELQNTPLTGIEGKYLILEVEGSEDIIYVSDSRIRIYLQGFKQSSLRQEAESLQDFIDRSKLESWNQWWSYLTDKCKALEKEYAHYQDLISDLVILELQRASLKDIPF